MGEDMERAIRLIGEGYKAFNQGDFDDTVEMMHPEIEWHRVADFEQPLHGPEAVREFFTPEVFESQRSEILEIAPLGKSHVLVHCRFHGGFAASGMELTQDGFHLWRIRDGLADQFRYFLGRDEAVRAAQG